MAAPDNQPNAPSHPDQSPPPSALEDFSAFYEREIAGPVQAIESERRKLISRALLFGIAGIAGVLIGIVAPIEPPMIRILLIGLGSVGLITACVCVYNAQQQVKGFFVNKLCTYFGLRYSAHPARFPLLWFDRLHMLPGYDRYGLEDHLSGSHEGVRIEVCDTHLEREYEDRDYKTGKTRTYYETVFRGLLCYFSFPKRFTGLTVVTNDSGGIGKWFTKFAMPGEPVHLEDPRFEDLFAVYSTDQVEARYLLTPGFMERILELSRQVGAYSMRLAFDAEHVLISLNHGRDYFEGGSAFSSAADPQRIKQVYTEFRLIFDVIETLGLTLKTRV